MREKVFGFVLAVALAGCGEDPVRVVSESMSPTFEPGDILFQTPLAHPGDVRRGMILVYDYFEGMPMGEPGELFVFRAVGLPGDRVSLRNDTLRLNGRVVYEPYANYEWPGGGRRPSVLPPQAEVRDVVVPEGTVFVLGDNRHNALDSRYHGPVPLENVRSFVE